MSRAPPQSGLARWADHGRVCGSPSAAHRPSHFWLQSWSPICLMKNDRILSQITEFCRQADMAESTFGRRAVNDGKLVHRLGEGKRITIDTLDPIQAHIA